MMFSGDIAERAWLSDKTGVHTPTVAMCKCVFLCGYAFVFVRKCCGYFLRVRVCVCVLRH